VHWLLQAERTGPDLGITYSDLAVREGKNEGPQPEEGRCISQKQLESFDFQDRLGILLEMRLSGVAEQA